MSFSFESPFLSVTQDGSGSGSGSGSGFGSGSGSGSGSGTGTGTRGDAINVSPIRVDALSNRVHLQVDQLRKENAQLKAEIYNLKNKLEEQSKLIALLQNNSSVKAGDSSSTFSPINVQASYSKGSVAFDGDTINPLISPSKQQKQADKDSPIIPERNSKRRTFVGPTPLATTPNNNNNRASVNSSNYSPYEAEGLGLITTPKRGLSTPFVAEPKETVVAQELLITSSTQPILGSSPRRVYSPRRRERTATSPLKTDFSVPNNIDSEILPSGTAVSVTTTSLTASPIPSPSPNPSTEDNVTSKIMKLSLSKGNEQPPSMIEESALGTGHSLSFAGLEEPDKTLTDSQSVTHRTISPQPYLQNDAVENVPSTEDRFETEVLSETTSLYSVTSKSSDKKTKQKVPAQPLQNTPMINQTPGFTDSEWKALLIKPDSIDTTLVSVYSVIDPANPSKKTDDPVITLGINYYDQLDQKLLFKVKKRYSQLQEVDQIFRPFFFDLPDLPEKTLFLKTTPNTIDDRRTLLTQYFNKIYDLKIHPAEFARPFCTFFSADAVFDFEDPSVKEAYFLRRNSNRLHSSSWRIVHVQLDQGQRLIISDTPIIDHGLSSRQQVIVIRDSTFYFEEELSTGGISILEPRRKGVLSSSGSKITLCCESYEEAKQWINLLNNLKSMHANTLISPVKQDSNTSNSSFYNRSSSTLNSPKVDMGSGNLNTLSSTRSTANTYDEASTPTSAKKTLKIGGLFKARREKDSSETVSINDDTFISNEFDTLKSTPYSAYTPTINSGQNNSSNETQKEYLPKLVFSSPEKFSDAPRLFGTSLADALEVSSMDYNGHLIPSIVGRCLMYLDAQKGEYQEGLFRLSGMTLEIKNLQDKFDTKYDVDLMLLPEKPDVHSVTTLLKRFLRTLKEPIVNTDVSKELLQFYPDLSKHQHEEEVKKAVSKLPTANCDLVTVFFSYLRKIVANQDINKMGVGNLGIIFAPNFGCSRDCIEVLLEYL
ncbi:BA75_03968T0 [Komagataella pastoris]|uniref:BA75_03968T0 n=1 Tax=Komagataella pastoris TaxID=4922 RepID=A0A1B2JGK0_PICPA|nr:BA75_03968T0 [Komagataella pastoris]